jgi:cytochrome P450
MEGFKFPPIQFLAERAERYGDIFTFRIGSQRAYFVKNPELIREVLVTKQTNFHKEDFLARGKFFLGEGLLTVEGEAHRRQRRLAQPAFHRERIANYGVMMTTIAERSVIGWQAGETLDMFQEMMRLTLGIVAKTLFDSDVQKDAQDVGEAFSIILERFNLLNFPIHESAEDVLEKQTAEFDEALAKLDEILYRIIREHREKSEDTGDFLSMLMRATDTEGNGEGMSDKQLRDEMMTFFFAGHETTANALSWTWYLLSQNPDSEKKFQQELDEILVENRLPNFDDLPNLTFTEQVFTESMRMFPPVWALGRLAVNDCEIGRYRIPKDSLVVVSQYITHHDSAQFAEPEKFIPERWTKEFKDNLPPFAYFPFGGGARRCIGENFAWMEGVLLLATIGRKWKFELQGKANPLFLLTLRPEQLKMKAQKRK